MGNASIRAAITRLEAIDERVTHAGEALLRDLAENVTGTLRDGWPIGRPRPGHLHSRDLWEWRQESRTRFVVLNTAPYADFVWNHPNQGGPPGIADRVLPELIDDIEADPLRYASDRTARLFGEM